ncbi:DNA primase [Nannocystis radixulma]|uniref:DNA primase n=1 Tax=Nannocystis radixulma TaxID=2995305 RepID=A0ABT5BHK1_9BACT|nr:DNA primase [Nannocystis radixulma]MDC0673637.1 DNA primase [Nannocystis radixulma]
MIPDEKLQELRDRIDIVDLVGRYVGLKRAGKNFTACCPFHQERTPSFFVNPERRSFKCFGCGVWGDGLEFVMRMDGLGFLEAARHLSGMFGVTLPEGLVDRKSSEQQVELEKARAITQIAADLYREILESRPEGKLGRLYQQQRAISPELATTFMLGYAPAPAESGSWDRLTRHLQSKGCDLQLAEKLGLVVRSDKGSLYDRFRGRLMFPVLQSNRKPIAFSGRILPEYAKDADGREAPKYMNSPESLLYTKSKTLFGLHVAGQAMSRARRAILVEGNVDVVSMHQRGYAETIAPLGTALTAQQAAILARFTDTVVLCFDGDNAGRKAIRAAIPILLDEGLDARVVALDAGADPDSTDPKRLAALLEEPGSALEWLVRQWVAQGALDSIDAQERAIGALQPLLAKVKSDAARERYAERAAKLLRLPPGRISSRQHPHGPPGPQGNRAAPSPPSRTAASPPAPARPLPELPRHQVALLALLVDNPHLADKAERAGVQQYVTDRRLAPIAEEVVRRALVGENPTEGELLEKIPAETRRQVHDAVFVGTFRDTQDDPVMLLQGCILDCRREQLKAESRRLDVQMREAKERGELDRARELSLKKIEHNRMLANLDEQALIPMSNPQSGLRA